MTWELWCKNPSRPLSTNSSKAHHPITTHTSLMKTLMADLKNSSSPITWNLVMSRLLHPPSTTINWEGTLLSGPKNINFPTIKSSPKATLTAPLFITIRIFRVRSEESPKSGPKVSSKLEKVGLKVAPVTWMIMRLKIPHLDKKKSPSRTIKSFLEVILLVKVLTSRHTCLQRYRKTWNSSLSLNLRLVVSLKAAPATLKTSTLNRSKNSKSLFHNKIKLYLKVDFKVFQATTTHTLGPS